MSRDRNFERWWTTEGKAFAKQGARFAASIAWSNAAYLARGGEPVVEFRAMKQELPDKPGLWAYRVPGDVTSTNVAITRGIDALYMHRPNGGAISLYQWARLYPKTRWKQFS